jgi:hypothetical protein
MAESGLCASWILLRTVQQYGDEHAGGSFEEIDQLRSTWPAVAKEVTQA